LSLKDISTELEKKFLEEESKIIKIKPLTIRRLMLAPHRARIASKRYRSEINAKIYQIENSLSFKVHEDQHYCAAIVKSLFDLYSLFPSKTLLLRYSFKL
jgi:hypothetical protein